MSNLRKLLDEATPGPWAVKRDKRTWGWVDVVGPSFSVGGPTRATNLSVADEAKRLTDARLIALAPDLAAALLEAEEALERLAKLGNGDSYGNSDGNIIARVTLTEIRKLTGAK
jgi:hypothetical protein